MPAIRKKRQPARIGISEAAAEAWRIGDFHALNRELGFGPHQISPFDAEAHRPGPTSNTNSHYAATWPRAQAVREALIEVAGPPGRYDRHGRPLGPAA